MYFERLKLVEPVLELKDEFLTMVKEFQTVKEQKENSLLDGALENFEKYVTKLRDYAKGKNLPQGWVPAASYWLLGRNRKVLGYSSLRHRLTPALRKFGGHIGYGIRPCERCKGNGSTILHLTLEKAHTLGLERVLVTCDDDNFASAKIVEKHGGVLEDKIMNEGHKVPTRRYWIELKRCKDKSDGSKGIDN